MRGLGVILLSFLLLALESPFLQQATSAHYTPDLAMLIALYLGLTSRLEAGLGLALAVGLVKDGFALGSPVGMYMEIEALTFLVSYRVSRGLALRGPIALMLIAALFSVGGSLVELGLSLVFDRSFTQGAGGASVILGPMIPQGLATGPFAPVVFWLFDRLDGLTTRKTDSLYGP